MSQRALVTGADRGLGLSLCGALLDRGWEVVAGRFMPDWGELDNLAVRHPGSLHIVPLDVRSDESTRKAAVTVEGTGRTVDLLVNNAGVINQGPQRTLDEPQDYAEMHRVMDVNTFGPLRVTESFLPIMRRGGLRRLCFVSSEAGSVGRAERTSWYGYCLSKAALNMAVKILFNHLRPEGFTFRLYHPGWMRTYMGGTRSLEATLEPDQAAEYAVRHFLDPRPDENVLALVDYLGEVWPW